MRLDFLVEGSTDKIILSGLLPQLVGVSVPSHITEIFSFRGLGNLPSPTYNVDYRKDRTLLGNLPALLRGYENSEHSNIAVIILVDVDNKCRVIFKEMLTRLVRDCAPTLNCLIFFAIEELEAWYLGDLRAVRLAFPSANTRACQGYIQDSICGTWEQFAEVVHPGGVRSINIRKYTDSRYHLRLKKEWANRISRYLDVANNRSPSFNRFCSSISNMTH